MLILLHISNHEDKVYNQVDHEDHVCLNKYLLGMVLNLPLYFQLDNNILLCNGNLCNLPFLHSDNRILEDTHKELSDLQYLSLVDNNQQVILMA